MCGIAGIIDPSGGIDDQTVTRMRDTITHRGPDDAGVWIDDRGRVGLGHRRLSILDLSEKGHQPMIDRQGRAVIVYNGEVYNFAEIRSRLQADGICFESDTDTEVILQAYLKWGEGFVERLEGMFAFAIWDTAENKLVIYRDRLGIKPLFYSENRGQLVFGSEIRAVLASGRVDRDLDVTAAWDFFSYGYVPTPATIYKSIKKLPPATMLKWQDGKIETFEYWQPRFECLEDDTATATAKIRELIDESVDAYLVSDVPTGAYLSGGVDSSIVTQRAAAAFDHANGRRLGGDVLHTFTIGFDVQEHSETEYARQAAENYHTDHSELVVSRQMSRDHDRTIIEMFDEPFAASSTIPMTFLAELARKKVTVALCGEGGDETFGGYSWYTWYRKFRKPGFWSTGAGRAVSAAYERITGKRKKKWFLPGLEDVELFAQLMGAMTESDRKGVFSADICRQMEGRDTAGYFRNYWRQDLPPVARMQLVDLKTFLPDLNLTRADRTSMRVALELRVPLLNHKLVEYACGLSENVRTPEGRLKGVFKQAVSDRLPESIRERKKKGFSAPVKEWFTGKDLSRLADEVVTDCPDIARSWLAFDLPSTAGRLKGSRAYKLWIFLQWLKAAA